MAFVYQYKDHLGNIRLSYSDNVIKNGIIEQNEIIEENNYYPFGLKHKGYNSNVSANGNSVAQKIKFGGNEHQGELNLNWYDITARNYDPALARWMNLDPLSEFMFYHGSYNYAFNNPIFFIDPDGLAPYSPTRQTGYYNDGAGNIVFDPNINDQADVDNLNLPNAKYVGDTYYDKSTYTFYDKNGIPHRGFQFNWLAMKYKWSLYLWLESYSFDDFGEIEYIGSGFVLIGKANDKPIGKNTRAKNSEDNIEIPEAVFNSLKGMLGARAKGRDKKSALKNFKNGLKDGKKGVRIYNEGKKIINGEGVYSDTTLDVNNSSVRDTSYYILSIWSDGTSNRGATWYGKKGAKKQASEYLKEQNVDSVSIKKSKK